jgi:hypothetical protein
MSQEERDKLECRVRTEMSLPPKPQAAGDHEIAHRAKLRIHCIVAARTLLSNGSCGSSPCSSRCEPSNRTAVRVVLMIPLPHSSTSKLSLAVRREYEIISSARRAYSIISSASLPCTPSPSTARLPRIVFANSSMPRSRSSLERKATLGAALTLTYLTKARFHGT